MFRVFLFVPCWSIAGLRDIEASIYGQYLRGKGLFSFFAYKLMILRLKNAGFLSIDTNRPLVQQLTCFTPPLTLPYRKMNSQSTATPSFETQGSMMTHDWLANGSLPVSS